MTKKPRFSTQAEISNSDQPEPPLADRVWRETSIVRPRSPIAGISGRYRKETIFSQRFGNTVVRPYVKPFDPETPTQLVRRSSFGEGSAHWSTIPAQARQDWYDYAAAHLRQRYPNSVGGNLAVNAYTSIQVCRTGMGRPFAEAAPAQPPPETTIAAIEQLPPLAPGDLRFRLHHDAPPAAGLRVLFQITRPLASARCHPQDNKYLWASQSDPDSFFDLGPDGTEYTIENPVAQIPPGAHYAVRVRAVTQDGLAGPPTTQFLVRL